MAVPTSGVLTMQGLAQEALYGTYGSGTITSPIRLYDLVNGGNTNGSGNSYPAVNQNCLPNPADRSSYIQFLNLFVGSTAQPTLYINPSQAATVQDLEQGDTIYTDAGLTTTAVAATYTQATGESYSFCATEDLMEMVLNSSGAITSIGCTNP